MRVQFWGTRGSIAKPGPSTARYGGNTSCIEVRSARDTLVIVDCGTGTHSLGQKLLSARGLRGHIKPLIIASTLSAGILGGEPVQSNGQLERELLRTIAAELQGQQ